MSKLFFAVHREEPDVVEARRRIDAILREITPDLAQDGAQRKVETDGRRFLGTLDAPADCPRHGLSICQGKLYDAVDWWRTGGALPEGSYTLIRGDDARIEAIVAPGGMRTLFYYFDEGMFVASNSQRAVTMYIGKFAFNREVAAWLISTGTIGPGRSYNSHLRQLAPGGVARLDRLRWSLDIEEPEVRFAPVERSEAEHLAAAEDALSSVMASFTAADAETTALSLSGGCDSRLIANLLHRLHPGIAWKSFSAGPAASETRPGSDPAVAAQVAQGFGFRHRFFVNDVSDEPIEDRLNRFVLLSEGRIDHFRGYAGGMNLLRAQRDAGITSVIRGDQAFGGPAIRNNDLRSINLLLCQNIEGVADHLGRFGLEGQHLPDSFLRRPEESFATWRDRLDLQFYCPSVLGALNEIKTFFFDVPQPLITARVQAVVLALPDRLRVGKSIIRTLMQRSGPDLPAAKTSGLTKLPDLLRAPQVARRLDASLGSSTAQECFGSELTGWIRREIARCDNPFFRARRLAARRLRSLSARGGGDELVAIGPRRLALRVHMAVTMADQLAKDAVFTGGDARQAVESAA